MNKKIIFFLLSIIYMVNSNANEHNCVIGSVVFNDILNCYIEEYKEYDKKLNKLYHQKISCLATTRKNKLRNSQRIWIKLKEKTCIVDEENYGRESHFEAMICEIEMTKERIKYLENIK
ncbi:DUF1311 domain-containing protein [Acinetobacter towneri]|nr:DUF1311 domain-containing protein [Acinetobacter towneri]